MTVSRRTVLTGLAASAVAVPLGACSSSGSSSSSSASPLTFDTTPYATLTKTVAVGSKNVDATHDARHFTLYSLRHATGNSSAQLPSDLNSTLPMMNPMYHLRNKNPSRARHWWIRTGALDTNTAHTVVGNLAAITTDLGDSVNAKLYWDGGHAVDFDSPDLMSWIGELAGYNT